MKKYLRLALMAFLISWQGEGFAQNIEIIPSYGYQFGTKLNYGPNYLKAAASDEFGVSLAFETAPGLMAGISYRHHGTELMIRDRVISPSEDRLSDLAMDWIMLEGTRYFRDDKVRPFAGAGLGVVIYSPSNENSALISNSLGSSTRFAFSFKAGINIMFTDRVGLNLQGNLFLPVEWGGFYIAGGSGGVSTGAGVSSTTIIGGFSGGLVFKLGN